MNSVGRAYRYQQALVPAEDATEAALVPGIGIMPVDNLARWVPAIHWAGELGKTDYRKCGKDPMCYGDICGS